MEKYTVTVDDYRTIRYFKEGTDILHREDGPAIEYASGDKYWYQNDRLHRKDGPASELANGTKAWYKEGKLHRLDGPACEYTNGDKFWYKDGEYHRENGPACEYVSGNKYWFIEGKEYTEAEFNQLTQKKILEITCDGKEVIIEGKKYILTLVDKP